MLNKLKKLFVEELPEVNCKDHEIIAPTDGKQIKIEDVKDEVFSDKVMGEGIAFELTGDSATICAPVNGTVNTIFETKHAFGMTSEDGVEILIHIGIDTVNLKGAGFEQMKVKSGDKIKAGTPVIKADLKKISEKYDTTTMLIITDENGKTIQFEKEGDVVRGQVIAQIS